MIITCYLLVTLDVLVAVVEADLELTYDIGIRMLTVSSSGELYARARSVLVQRSRNSFFFNRWVNIRTDL